VGGAASALRPRTGVFILNVSHVRLFRQVDLVRARSVLEAPDVARLKQLATSICSQQLATAFCNIRQMFAGVKRWRQETNKVKRALNIVRRAIFYFHRGAAKEIVRSGPPLHVSLTLRSPEFHIP